MVKVLDYGQDWAGLEASANPFAVVVMAYLKARETLRTLLRQAIAVPDLAAFREVLRLAKG